MNKNSGINLKTPKYLIKLNIKIKLNNNPA